MKWILLLILLSSVAFAECVDLVDGMTISESMTLCSDTYDIPNGITIDTDNIILECNTAVLRGIVGQSEIGLRLENVDGVTVRGCNIITFNQGLYLKNVTNSLIEDNSFLKNRIGVRLLDSFENTIQDNNDKSLQVAVSSINSKFNIVMMGNKNIERSFCKDNACNEYRDMNVCESGDFYCSKKCTPATDSDCGSTEPVNESISTPQESQKSVDELIEEAVQSVEKKPIQKETMTLVKKSLPLNTTLTIYLIMYIITFIILYFNRRNQ